MQTYWVRFEDIPIWEKCPKCTYISWSTCILHNKVLIFLKNEEKNILNIFLIFGDHCTVRGSLLLHSGGLVNYTGRDLSPSRERDHGQSTEKVLHKIRIKRVVWIYLHNNRCNFLVHQWPVHDRKSLLLRLMCAI